MAHQAAEWRLRVDMSTCMSRARATACAATRLGWRVLGYIAVGRGMWGSQVRTDVNCCRGLYIVCNY